MRRDGSEIFLSTDSMDQNGPQNLKFKYNFQRLKFGNLLEHSYLHKMENKVAKWESIL